jgi:hypothetical protein
MQPNDPIRSRLAGAPDWRKRNFVLVIAVNALVVAFPAYVFSSYAADHGTIPDRARIVVSGMATDLEKDEHGNVASISFAPIIINSGNTPTKGMSFVTINPASDILLRRVHHQHQTISDSPDDPMSFFDVAEARPQNYVLGPHLALPRVLPSLKLDRQMFEEIIGGKLGRYYYGAIKYHDIFNPEIEHVTKYCFAVNNFITSPNGMALQGPAGNAKVIPFYTNCPHWNCADDECEWDRHRYDEEVAASRGDKGPSPAPRTPQ